MLKQLVLKTLAPAIAPVLQVIFQRSIDSGQILSDWHTANIVPIYKKGDKLDPSNYRPVSLTCVCSKIMEHIITSQLMKHLETNGLLHHRQHGFRSKHSCETQLEDFFHQLHNSLEKGKRVDAVMMDLSKAFDKVAHNRLLLKLERCGIQGSTNRWNGSFLSGRSQKVVADGEHSSSAPFTSGVPQGSVIDPALFLEYINGLLD